MWSPPTWMLDLVDCFFFLLNAREWERELGGEGTDAHECLSTSARPVGLFVWLLYRLEVRSGDAVIWRTAAAGTCARRRDIGRFVGDGIFLFFFSSLPFRNGKKERKKKTPTTEGTPADDLLSAWYGVTWTACVYTHVGYVAPATTTPQYWPTAALFFLSTKKVT